MDLQAIGRVILTIGIVVVMLGGALMLLDRIPFFSNLGNMPGDIHVEGRNFSCFAPIGTMIILSLLLTVILNIVVRLINRQ
jgi:hypothetical protein